MYKKEQHKISHTVFSSIKSLLVNRLYRVSLWLQATEISAGKPKQNERFGENSKRKQGMSGGCEIGILGLVGPTAQDTAEHTALSVQLLRSRAREAMSKWERGIGSVRGTQETIGDQ